MNCWVFFCVCTAKSYFLKNIHPKNQIILFLFWRPNDLFFAVSPIDQKINVVSPEAKIFFRIAKHFFIHTAKNLPQTLCNFLNSREA